MHIYNDEEEVLAYANSYVNDNSKLMIAYFSCFEHDIIFPFLKQNYNAQNIFVTAFTEFEIDLFNRNFIPESLPLIIPQIAPSNIVVLKDEDEELLLRKLQN